MFDEGLLSALILLGNALAHPTSLTGERSFAMVDAWLTIVNI
jgi:hypothetical protein